MKGFILILAIIPIFGWAVLPDLTEIRVAYNEKDYKQVDRLIDAILVANMHGDRSLNVDDHFALYSIKIVALEERGKKNKAKEYRDALKVMFNNSY